MGGGAIRTAAKVAGMTAATGGIRSVTAEHYPFSSVFRKATSSRPAVAAADEMKLVASNSETGVQRPCLEFDDWVFPVIEEEFGAKDADPMPRVVFAGVPTLEEAKEATSELSVALEKTFLSSPNSVGCEGLVVADHDSSLPLSDREDVDTKAYVTSHDIMGVPAIPAPAMTAFKFLHESSAAKNVVASIACDPNVWNAVMQNNDLQKFLQSQSACVSYTDRSFSSESDYDAKSFDGASEYSESGAANGFTDFFQKMKRSVVDMMSSLSDYFKELFGGTKISGDTVMERSFIGLAVMAILVILLKRV